jgi:hypothetical protein
MPTLLPSAIVSQSGLYGSLAALADDPGDPDELWMTVTPQSGITQLFPSGPAYATGAETRAAIIAESTKAANDARRPLPLAANWNMYSTPLSWQLAKIDDGYPILPFVEYNKDMSVANFTGTGYPKGNADALSSLATYGLPLSLQYPNLASPLYTDATYIDGSVSNADTAMQVRSRDVSAAVANGTTSVTVTFTNTGDLWTAVGSPVTFSDFTGGWAALNGTHTITGRGISAKTVTVAVNGSGFGTWSSGGKGLLRLQYLSPMGTDVPWAALGAEHGECDVMAHLQSVYPNPPRVIICDNNESRKISHTQWGGDQRFIDANPTLVSNLNSSPNQYNDQPMEMWHYALIDRHNAMFGAWRDGMTEEAWPNALTFVGYNANIANNFRISDLWWKLSDTWESTFVEGEFDRLAWQPYAWDGTTPNLYIWNNFEWYPFETRSPQNYAMVYKMGQDIAESINANYWGEFSSWDGELFDGGDHESVSNAVLFKTTKGIDYNVDYYKGWVQWCMWMMRPRCVREFRYHVLFNEQSGSIDLSTTSNEWGARWHMHLDMVSHVHQHPTLRRFWREGTLVENTNTLIGNSYTHPQQFLSGYTGYAVKALAWDAYPKNYHLPASLDHVDEYYDNSGLNRIATYLSTGRVDYPVWALAYVIGTTPNREWLVYAHSTGIEGATLENVEVTIPGYQTITLPTVPVQGAFYYVVE